MLQQGVTVSDILYLTPEGAPHVFRPPSSAMENAEGRLPDKKGYGFDACSPKILIERAEVKDGLIAFPGGTSYRLMVLPQFKTMTPELLEKIMELVEAGATIMGAPSLKSPSLVNYPAADQKLQALAIEFWGGLEAPKELTKRSYALGNIYWGGTSTDGLYPHYDKTASILLNRGVEEDFSTTESIRYAHRQTDDRDIYFLSNYTDQSLEAHGIFRVGEGQPELWDPLTGTSRSLPQYEQNNALTTIPLTFLAYQSYFVVFPRHDSSKVGTADSGVNFPSTKELRELTGPWELSFDTLWGGPEKIIFDSLYDWTSSKDDGVKYYAGMATYRKTFVLSDLPKSETPLYLNLGKVHEMARVTLNGADLGVVWCKPWQVDITTALKEGENKLEIEVVNLWPNRLIGDAALPPEERLTWTIEGHPYTTDSELLPSGLLGPVIILKQKD